MMPKARFMRFRLPTTQPTIHGQIMALILLGLLIVLVGGSMLERRVRDDYAVLDIEKLANGTFAISSILETAPAAERDIILAAAIRSGWNVSLQPTSLLQQLTTTSSTETFFDIAIDKFFPPDNKPAPLRGWKTFLNDDRVIAVRVDDANILVLSNLPKAFLRSDALGFGSNYLVAFITLIILFSLFGIWAITRPLRKIASAAMNADLSPGPAIFEEKGSVEIVALARALNNMRARIAAMVDGRTRMLRGVSHDLRTPLTRLRLRVERVQQTELRDALLIDINHIDSLLKESLSYLRDDHRRETMERADLAIVLQTICNEFNDVGHNITYHGPNRLITNFKPLAFTRAVTNLCENATKFGTSIIVELRSATDAIVIDVSDDGPGIPAQHRSRVLEPFYKVDAARGGGEAGFGLGLSIVSEIIESHQGQLQLLERQPHGLIARLTLPRL
ncbi:ATP-binding protein [Rhizobium terrae]|uniref:ATP-binding protein n=1 Tax=Rhizobium terrae TaxID=2171756 RepID=UPI001D002C9A|nr:ATP-binding protein [Rhizobium terrae]